MSSLSGHDEENDLQNTHQATEAESAFQVMLIPNYPDQKPSNHARTKSKRDQGRRDGWHSHRIRFS
jgi:hypothetical protein